jgi:hypothetical protein
MDATGRLIKHLRECPICLAAKATKRGTKCMEGRELVLLTLKERHGDE